MQKGSAISDLLDKVRAALSEYGEEGKDFVILPADNDRESVKVLFKSVAFVSTELTIALNDLLYHCSNRHAVLLLLAEQNWRPIVPTSGFRIVFGQIDSIPPLQLPEIPRDAAQRTETLRLALSGLLSTMGHEDSRGEGDYWIFDDWMGPYSQKVYIWRVEFITSELVQRVRQMLESFPECEVILSLDEAIPHPQSGLRLAARNVEEQWDRAVLRELFGSRLKY